MLTFLFFLALCSSVTHSQRKQPAATADSSDYYYYYEDYYDVPATPVRSKESSDYNLEELVKAWKEYIKERGPERTTTAKPIEYECPPREASYRTPDPEQCDKFYECNIKGEEAEMLCPDGLVFDIKAEHCDYPSKVNCSGRPKLQEPQSTKNCPRANGYYKFPPEESCQKFYDCRAGVAYLQTCPEGVIFDPTVDACVTPDQSPRKECRAGKFLGFECPKYSPDEPLRFGNHDRLSHPSNCQQFFSCLRTGEPRLGACPRKTVFNNATGHCDDPEKVSGCENYWIDKLEEEYDDGSYDYNG